MKPSMHPVAPDHLPGFITAPREVDVLFVAVAILIIIAIVIIGTFYFKNYGIRHFKNRSNYVIQAEFFGIMVKTMMLTQNKYFGIAALLLAIIPIPDIMTLVKNKILRRRRAELIDLSSILHQAAQTSQTEMLLGEASRQADGRNHLTKSAAVERDPKKWLLH